MMDMRTNLCIFGNFCIKAALFQIIDLFINLIQLFNCFGSEIHASGLLCDKSQLLFIKIRLSVTKHELPIHVFLHRCKGEASITHANTINLDSGF